MRERIQTNGRCEAAIERGDTYGPVSYLAYVPAVAVFPWSGKWDSLPAAHATSIAFDLLAVLALVLVGMRFGGLRLGVLLAFAWAAYPFTAYTLNANTNDAIMPAFLLLGFLLVTSDWARGASVALAGWTKFGALLVAPLWATYPVADLRRVARFAAAFAVATVLAFAILLLEPSLLDAVRTFWERSVGFQSGRDSPFSIWGWGQYHAEGIPDLGFLQPVVAVLAVALAGVVAIVPRRKTPLRLAALTAAVLCAFQLTLTHWFYLYIPWVVPFVFLWLLLPERDGSGDGHAERLDGRRLAGRGVAVDHRALDPHASLSRLEAHGQAGAHPPDRELGLDADDRVVRPGHSGVRDEGGALRQHCRVGGLHVRVRSDDRGHAAVEVARHRGLLARRLGVHVHEDDGRLRRAPRRRARR